MRINAFVFCVFSFFAFNLNAEEPTRLCTNFNGLWKIVAATLNEDPISAGDLLIEQDSCDKIVFNFKEFVLVDEKKEFEYGDGSRSTMTFFTRWEDHGKTFVSTINQEYDGDRGHVDSKVEVKIQSNGIQLFVSNILEIKHRNSPEKDEHMDLKYAYRRP